MSVPNDNSPQKGSAKSFYTDKLKQNFKKVITAEDYNKDIAEKMTNRNIRRERLIERMRDVLQEEFEKGDTNKDGKISLDELQAYVRISGKKGRIIPPDKVRELFRSLDTNNSGDIDINEFCVSYADKIDQHEQSIIECKNQLVAINSQLKDLNEQKRDVARTELLNQFGIMEGSVLIVTVVECRDLTNTELAGTIDPFCTLECEGQKIETSYKSDTLNPIFNE